MSSEDAGRDPLIVIAVAAAAAALMLYLAAFWPTIVGEASNACEGRDFDRSIWPPAGNCGDLPARQFGWSWPDAVVLGLLAIAATSAIGWRARR